MDKIRVEEETVLNEGTCNWCDGAMDVPSTSPIKLVYFDQFYLRLCATHYREMLAAWVRIFVDEFLPEG